MAEEEEGETKSSLEKGKGDGSRQVKSLPHEEGTAKLGPPGDTSGQLTITKGADKKVSDIRGEEVERTREFVGRENSPESQARTAEVSISPDLPNNSALDTETSQREEDKTRSKWNLDLQDNGTQPEKAPDSTQDVEHSDAAEVHPETKTKPTVGFTEPPQLPSRPVSESITPAVSPDDSPLPSRRPRTLSFISERYSGLLGHGLRPDSTSSSSDLLESPLFAARRRLLNQSKSFTESFTL